jgi:hypothetical protein
MMKTVAFYDQDTGEITEVTQGPMRSLIDDRRPYVFLPEFRRDWDVTHKVVADQLVAK